MPMRSIQGLISAAELDIVNSVTPLRFRDVGEFETPEALILYEQGIMSNDKIIECIAKDTGRTYATPRLSYIPREILNYFSSYNVVPISFDNLTDTIYLGVLYEKREDRIPPYKNKQVEKVFVPMHWYVENYTKLYSVPTFLYPLPIKDIFDFIVSEAISVGAADITISSRADSAKIYYNARKRNVQSRRAITKDNVTELADFISTRAKQPMVDFVNQPRYLSVDLDTHHRGRVAVVGTYHGKSTTIRVLPNELFNTSLEELNLNERTISFIREKVESDEYGLRIFVGPTFSGKNTTIASILREMLKDERRKGISVEQPVELLMDFLEQMPSETQEDFQLNVSSLLRQNPDVVYITEMTDFTARETLNVSNTGKIVFTALHANGIADVPARLQDLTGLPVDRILLNIQSVIFQELKRDEDADKIYPVTRCVHFSRELRNSLFGKSLSDITKILREEEDKWDC